MSKIANAFKDGKAFIAFLTGGDPAPEKTVEYILTMEKAGADLIEIGIPFSDPTAEGVVIQDANIRALKAGTTTDKIFEIVKEVRKTSQIPLVFLTYLNPVFHYGYEAFFKKCKEYQVDGLIIPDLPLEEQQPLKDALAKQNATILIQLVAPVSDKRIPEILKDARGFVYCVSSMGVTGQGANFHKEVISYLKSVKEQAQIPIMMGFGIRTAADVEPMKDIIDGAIVGSHFINLMEENQYDLDVAKEYIQTFKSELK